MGRGYGSGAKQCSGRVRGQIVFVPSHTVVNTSPPYEPQTRLFRNRAMIVMRLTLLLRKQLHD